jgi:hypothetical protein
MALLHATVSDFEWAAGVLERGQLEAVVRNFREEGFACIGNVIPAATLDSLRPRLNYDAAHQAATAKCARQSVSQYVRNSIRDYCRMLLPVC